MKLAVFGLGYVGAVSSACFADDGHEVVGVDKARGKVDAINAGTSPIVEESVPELIAAAAAAGRLTATTDAAAAVAEADASIVCVGTPSRPNGDLMTDHVEAVAAEIGRALADRDAWHAVVVRSTVLPGTLSGVVLPILERESGKKAGRDFGLAFHPEFLREGSAVADFRDPPKTVVGAFDERTADFVASLYDGLDAPLFSVDPETAEIVKYADNAWHAVKVGFANELGNVAKAVGVDGQRLMEIFCADDKLNLSARYLRPGFAYGGSCLPKDLRALNYKAAALDLTAPILASVADSNDVQIRRGLDMVLAHGRRRVGVLGMSFKAGTDDLRESPVVALVEGLLGKGLEVRVYDRNVNLARVTGANRDFLLERLPHVTGLLVDDVDELLEFAETLVVGNADPEFATLAPRLRADQTVVDLVGVRALAASAASYDGICW